MSSRGGGHVFTNARVLLNSKLEQTELWVNERGIVCEPLPVSSSTSSDGDAEEWNRIDCGGRILAPGLIDVQLNGGWGVDFNDTSLTVDEFERGLLDVSERLLSTGVSSFCPTIVTTERETYDKVLPVIGRLRDPIGSRSHAKSDTAAEMKSRESSTEQSRSPAPRARILGAHLEGPFITNAGAHPKHLVRSFDAGFFDVIELYGTVGHASVVTLAPELRNASEVAEELARRHIAVSMGHSKCSTDEAFHAANISTNLDSHGEASDGINEPSVPSSSSGYRMVTHLHNAMRSHHRDPGLVALAMDEKSPLFYSVIPDGQHIHPLTVRSAWRQNPNKLMIITDSIHVMGLPPGKHTYLEKTIDVQEDRAVFENTDALVGASITMDNAVRNFRRFARCSRAEALECGSLHPAQALQLSDRIGSFDVGAVADFILLDDDLDIHETWIQGVCAWRRSDVKAAGQ